MQQTLQLIHPQTFFKILPCRYQKSPLKSSKIQNFPIQNHLSYHISSNHTKIKHFSHFITKKSNPHPTKNPPTIPKSSLFVDTFTDNVFSPQNRPNHLSPHPLHRGCSKTTRKTINTVIALSYFYAKKQIKQRIYNQKLVNRNNISTRKDREI